MKKNKDKIYIVLFFIILLLGVVSRCYHFRSLPGGLNHDEGYALYEAYSLLHYGTDSWGYSFPVYFTSWGSGMNVLQSYLAIPFVAVFGMQAVAIRLPSLIMSILAIVFSYFIGKELKNKTLGIIFMFLMSISPWNIMVSRFGVEANMAYSFILIAFYFLFKGVKNNKYFIIAAILFGLSLYGYAAVWPIIPISLVLIFIYLMYTKQKIITKQTIAAVFILFIIALPLILFMLINNGFIDEIKTSFISIPKMLVIREADYSLSFLPHEISPYFDRLIFKQTDYTNLANSKGYGLYYFITVPFLFIGFIKVIINTLSSIRKKEFCKDVLVLVYFLVASISLCMMNKINMSHSNYLIPFLILISSCGIEICIDKLSNIKIRNSCIVLLSCAYLLFFGLFCYEYFIQNASQYNTDFRIGFDKCIEYANGMDKDVYIDSNLEVNFGTYYSYILVGTKMTPKEIKETAKFKTYPAQLLDAEQIGKFYYKPLDKFHIDDNTVYITDQNQELIDYFEYYGFIVEYFGNYIVAYHA